MPAPGPDQQSDRQDREDRRQSAHHTYREGSGCREGGQQGTHDQRRAQGDEAQVGVLPRGRRGRSRSGTWGVPGAAVREAGRRGDDGRVGGQRLGRSADSRARRGRHAGALLVHPDHESEQESRDHDPREAAELAEPADQAGDGCQRQEDPDDQGEQRTSQRPGHDTAVVGNQHPERQVGEQPHSAGEDRDDEDDPQDHRIDPVALAQATAHAADHAVGGTASQNGRGGGDRWRWCLSGVRAHASTILPSGPRHIGGPP